MKTIILMFIFALLSATEVPGNLKMLYFVLSIFALVVKLEQPIGTSVFLSEDRAVQQPQDGHDLQVLWMDASYRNVMKDKTQIALCGKSAIVG